MQPIASSLNSNDVFVLKSPDSLWQWKGKGATTEEIARAKDVALLLGGSATEVEETNEPGVHYKELSSLQFNTVKCVICTCVLLVVSWFLGSTGWKDGISELCDTAEVGQASTTV